MRKILTTHCMWERITGRGKAIKDEKFSNTVSCLIRYGLKGVLDFSALPLGVPVGAALDSTCFMILFI